MNQRKIAFIGAGNMAGAIVSGLVKNGYPADLITVTAPSSQNRDALATSLGVISSGDNIAAANAADVVVLSVKPQLMQAVCEALKGHVNFENKLVLTIAAGIVSERYNDYLDCAVNLIRIMPNTPSLVGEGVAGLFATSNVSEQDKDYASALMQAVGQVAWVEKEAQINDIIAVTGSSPAYFFLFMQAMQQKAEDLGFDAATARSLVLQAAKGAAALAAVDNDMAFATLRENVTSKGGTTAAALNVFAEHQLEDTVALAMQAAIHRADEMQKLF